MKINILNIGKLSLFYRIHSNGEYYKWYEEYGIAAWQRYDSITWSWILWLVLSGKRGNKGIFHYQKQSVIKKKIY